MGNPVREMESERVITKTMMKQWMLENNGPIIYDPLHPWIFTGYVTWTPERCESALDNNTENRDIQRKRQLPGIKAALENGLWDDNVSKINFTKDGTLSDGQHRIVAGAETGIAFRSLVTWGVEREAQLVTDRRGSRTLANDFQIKKYPNAKKLAAVTRVLYQLDNGATPKQIASQGGERTLPDVMLYNYYNQNAEYITKKERLVAKVYNSVRDLGINRGNINLLVSVFDDIDPDDADCFWGKLSSGVASSDDDPVVALRKRLSDNAHSKTSKIPKVVEAALIIKAWNLFERGETTKLLKYTAGGANPEPFPSIYNPNNEN